MCNTGKKRTKTVKKSRMKSNTSFKEIMCVYISPFGLIATSSVGTLAVS